jgi:hypothetical protein
MPNTFLNLEISRGDGVGDSSDTGLTAATKTFIYPGTPAGRFAVEGSHDGYTWAVVIGRERTQQAFFSGNRSQVLTVDAVVKQLRVRATGTRGVACPEGIGLGAPPAAGKNVFAQLPVPKDGDRGEPFDLGAKTGLLKTFILGEGAQSSTGFSVLASVDGERFGEVLRLQGGNQDRMRTVAAVCRFLRIDRIGPGVCPHITVGAEGLAEAQSGSGGNGGNSDATALITLSDERAAATSSASDEEVLREFYVPLAVGSWPHGIEATLSAFCATEGDEDGRAVFNLRMGGRPGRADGDALIHITGRGQGSAEVATSHAFSQPYEPTTLIKVTGKGDGTVRAALRSLVITFHAPE